MCWLQWFCSWNTRYIYLSIESQSQNSNHQVVQDNLEAVLGMEHSSYPCCCTNFVCIHLFKKKIQYILNINSVANVREWIQIYLYLTWSFWFRSWFTIYWRKVGTDLFFCWEEHWIWTFIQVPAKSSLTIRAIKELSTVPWMCNNSCWVGMAIRYHINWKKKYQTKLNSAFIYFEVFFISIGYDNEDSSLT